MQRGPIAAVAGSAPTAMSAGARPVTLLSNMDRRTLLQAITVGAIAATVGSPRAHADPVPC